MMKTAGATRTPAPTALLRGLLILCLVLAPLAARAEIDSTGVLDNVLARYSAIAATWSATITTHATRLFWTLATISMVWTFGMMALRKADIGEFFAEFARFTIFTGFYWWLLRNGPAFATSIMDSMRVIAANANGSSTILSPSGIVDIGFDIFAMVLSKSTVWSPFSSAVGVAISLITLIVLALIGVNMLLLLISGWILAYAGIFFLGFGGSRWTSDMAINYYKTVLSIGAQLFTMVLLVGIGKSFMDEFYTNISAAYKMKELAVIMVVAIILLALVNKVPSLIGGLAMGGGTGALGSGFGAGTALGAAAMAATAAATAGAAAVAGTANIAGGVQALMAAVSKANAAESAGSGTRDFMASAGGGGSGTGPDPGTGSGALAAAMGDTAQAASSSADVGSGSAETQPAGSAPQQSQPPASPANQQSANGPANAGSEGKTGQRAAKTAPGMGSPAAAAALAAKTGRIAAGAAGNLAQGTWDVGKAKVRQGLAAAGGRVGKTIGGQIAAAIKSRDQVGAPDTGASAIDDGSLSAGDSSSADPTGEVAAFRDRKPE
ncbi:P-type conjugative transfer protein TrbL [Janthinobacterium sp. SUN137]|uniref:P-type conjugative transfer protein TrbL n=1 Tax=Janthinobacterium sp. SUN137 TaxID=3014789 RepID=UPI002713BA27|nr:P-type conjugative transfer protein TrbL [Janthinobacterium sp. SUN137]MDO8039554.1 P-type conjugative transfer protein TrbL [Janthinobacterium sp. SUN137]